MIDRLIYHITQENVTLSVVPLPPGIDLRPSIGKPFTDERPYQRLIGTLLHLSNIARPEIIYATYHLPPFLNPPTEALWSPPKIH